MSRDQIQINSCKEVVWPAPIVRQTSVKQNNVKVLQMIARQTSVKQNNVKVLQMSIGMLNQ